ncbi:MAG: hypothetical protein HYS83_02095 [Candidatus Blackburnbacteria bacterium]|nr:hypothetical protein [Candidatus Blackburnbacteria bacterium]
MIKQEERLREALVSQMLQLATSGFGLVAALAWNSAIQTAIDDYIKPLIGGGSALASQIIYALVVTMLAVTITYQLTRLSKKLGKNGNGY